MDQLDDPGVLAEVTQRRTFSTRIPVYSELMQAVQELSSAMHKFHKTFNNKAGQLVLQIKATKKRIGNAQVWVRVQNALIELARGQQL